MVWILEILLISMSNVYRNFSGPRMIAEIHLRPGCQTGIAKLYTVQLVTIRAEPLDGKCRFEFRKQLND